MSQPSKRNVPIDVHGGHCGSCAGPLVENPERSGFPLVCIACGSGRRWANAAIARNH